MTMRPIPDQLYNDQPLFHAGDRDALLEIGEWIYNAEGLRFQIQDLPGVKWSQLLYGTAAVGEISQPLGRYETREELVAEASDLAWQTGSDLVVYRTIGGKWTYRLARYDSRTSLSYRKDIQNAAPDLLRDMLNRSISKSGHRPVVRTKVGGYRKLHYYSHDAPLAENRLPPPSSALFVREDVGLAEYRTVTATPSAEQGFQNLQFWSYKPRPNLDSPILPLIDRSKTIYHGEGANPGLHVSAPRGPFENGQAANVAYKAEQQQFALPAVIYKKANGSWYYRFYWNGFDRAHPQMGAVHLVDVVDLGQEHMLRSLRAEEFHLVGPFSWNSGQVFNLSSEGLFSHVGTVAETSPMNASVSSGRYFRSDKNRSGYDPDEEPFDLDLYATPVMGVLHYTEEKEETYRHFRGLGDVLVCQDDAKKTLSWRLLRVKESGTNESLRDTHVYYASRHAEALEGFCKDSEEMDFLYFSFLQPEFVDHPRLADVEGQVGDYVYGSFVEALRGLPKDEWDSAISGVLDGDYSAAVEIEEFVVSQWGGRTRQEFLPAQDVAVGKTVYMINASNVTNNDMTLSFRRARMELTDDKVQDDVDRLVAAGFKVVFIDGGSVKDYYEAFYDQTSVGIVVDSHGLQANWGGWQGLEQFELRDLDLKKVTPHLKSLVAFSCYFDEDDAATNFFTKNWGDDFHLVASEGNHYTNETREQQQAPASNPKSVASAVEHLIAIYAPDFSEDDPQISLAWRGEQEGKR